jgi:hypothetical protein
MESSRAEIIPRGANSGDDHLPGRKTPRSRELIFLVRLFLRLFLVEKPSSKDLNSSPQTYPRPGHASQGLPQRKSPLALVFRLTAPHHANTPLAARAVFLENAGKYLYRTPNPRNFKANIPNPKTLPNSHGHERSNQRTAAAYLRFFEPARRKSA